MRKPFSENTALNRESLLSSIRNGEHSTANHCFWLYANSQRPVYYELRCRHCYCCDVYCGRNHVHAQNVSAVDSTPLFAHGYTRCKLPICSVTRSWVPKLCVYQQYEACDFGAFATLRSVVISFFMSGYYWLQIFAVFWILYSFFWVITRRLNFMCPCFGTLCGVSRKSVPIFAVFWMLYSFFWVITRRLNFMCRRFGTLWCKQEECLHMSVTPHRTPRLPVDGFSFNSTFEDSSKIYR